MRVCVPKKGKRKGYCYTKPGKRKGSKATAPKTGGHRAKKQCHSKRTGKFIKCR